MEKVAPPVIYVRNRLTGKREEAYFDHYEDSYAVYITSSGMIVRVRLDEL